MTRFRVVWCNISCYSTPPALRGPTAKIDGTPNWNELPRSLRSNPKDYSFGYFNPRTDSIKFELAWIVAIQVIEDATVE